MQLKRKGSQQPQHWFFIQSHPQIVRTQSECWTVCLTPFVFFYIQFLCFSQLQLHLQSTFFQLFLFYFFPHMQANHSNHTGIIANPDTPLSLPCLQVLRVEGWHTGGLVSVAFVGHKAMQPCTWVTLRDSFLVNLFARVFCTNVASSLWFGLLSIWEKTFSEFSENSALLTRTPKLFFWLDLLFVWHLLGVRLVCETFSPRPQRINIRLN